jgi:hypothetical protein
MWVYALRTSVSRRIVYGEAPSFVAGAGGAKRSVLMQRRTVLLGFVVGIVISVVAACGSDADDRADERVPTITFDGTTAVYSGPSEVAAYPPVQTVRLVNDSDVSVDFTYAAIKPDEFEAITEQYAIDWGLNPENADKYPPWLGNVGHFAKHVLAGETLDVDAAFIAGETYELGVWKPSTQTGHFAAWIDAIEAHD